MHRIAEILIGDGHSATVKAYIVGLFGEFLYLIEAATTGKNTYMTRMISTTHLLAHHIPPTPLFRNLFQGLLEISVLGLFTIVQAKIQAGEYFNHTRILLESDIPCGLNP